GPRPPGAGITRGPGSTASSEAGGPGRDSFHPSPHPVTKEMEDSMRHQPISAATALVLTLIAVDPASAITHGKPDGNAHPYVGLVLFYDESGTLTHRCTGTLITPRVVLTAGHCTFGAAAAQVWFNAEVTPATVPGYPFSGGVMGTPYTHPGYDP